MSRFEFNVNANLFPILEVHRPFFAGFLGHIPHHHSCIFRSKNVKCYKGSFSKIPMQKKAAWAPVSFSH